ncbi:glycosyltransferase family 39 protein [Pseudomonas sp. 6D_7.1_Bac1]|uniref:glycosyltransferase family 39 protein n=1 Tax=Pseudomonas sp. 6D_7.1_Bac1 TaxID=2971615 RepID=UPI0021C76A1B|nr:glycosyltransferase family 39 protein [Pseudomonas sp. 6D_7.1_Bac1]MCU1749565.1 glycosyltransferase family 39 protein [Pseudomonas sp. 6D_7.1_Bac1]
MSFQRRDNTGFVSQRSSLDSAGWVLVMMLALIVRFHDISLPYFWTDEAFSALVGVQSPERIWFHLGHDVHPPLYFLLLHVWMSVFGEGVFAIRALSALAGVATVMLGVWLMRLITTPRAALLAGLFLALLPISVRYSQEARMYTLEGVWLLGATIALVYWIKSARNRYLASYVVLMTAALYTHYLAVLCLLSHWLYLVVLRLQRDETLHYLSRPIWWVANVAIVILYIPWLISLGDELFLNTEKLKTGGDIFWIPELTIYTLPSAVWKFLTVQNGLEFARPVYLMLPVLVLASVVWVGLKERSRLKLELLLVIYVLLPVLIVFMVSFGFAMFVERYVAFAALGLPMIAALAVSRIARRTLALAWASVLLIVGVQLMGLNTIYKQQDDLDDPRNESLYPLDNIVSRINENAIVGDNIIVDGAYWYYSVAYYNRSDIQPRLYQAPWDNSTANRPNGYGASTLIYQDRDKVFLDNLVSVSPDIKRVWWVTSTRLVDDENHFPGNWQCVFAQGAGDMELRLYVTSASAQRTTGGCSTQPPEGHEYALHGIGLKTVSPSHLPHP